MEEVGIFTSFLLRNPIFRCEVLVCYFELRFTRICSKTAHCLSAVNLSTIWKQYNITHIEPKKLSNIFLCIWPTYNISPAWIFSEMKGPIPFLSFIDFHLDILLPRVKTHTIHSCSILFSTPKPHGLLPSSALSHTKLDAKDTWDGCEKVGNLI